MSVKNIMIMNFVTVNIFYKQCYEILIRTLIFFHNARKILLYYSKPKKNLLPMSFTLFLMEQLQFQSKRGTFG